jgi:hypothetical protein
LRLFQRRLAALALAAFAAAIGAADPPTGLAFPLAGCTQAITSLDADGAAVDSAAGGGPDASQEAPLQVHWDGTIIWSGTTGSQAIAGRSWHVDVFGLPTPLRGNDANEDGDTSGEDSVRISEAVPFRFTGLFHVSGQLKGDGGGCTGDGWVRVVGDPMSTLPFLVALALVLVGVVLLAVGARGRWLPALAGGLLLGLGSTVLLVIYAVLPLGAATPPVVTLLGLLTGACAGWLGRVQVGRAERGTPS